MMMVSLLKILPALLYISMALIGLGMSLAKHGQPKSGKEDAWINAVAMIVIWAVLYWGGFFNPLLGR